MVPPLPRGMRRQPFPPALPSLSRTPRRQHLVLGAVQRHTSRTHGTVESQLIAVLRRGLLPRLEPEVLEGLGMPTKPDWDEMVEYLSPSGNLGVPARASV